MEISFLILLLIGSVGMTMIVVEGEIFVPIKNFMKKFMPSFFMKMMDCHQCCGFWSGLLLSFFFYTPMWAGMDTGDCIINLMQTLGKNFASGCAASLLSVFWAAIMMFIESKTMIQN